MQASQFGAATQAWFDAAFAAPTDAQRQAWEVIAGGRHALVVAPTGSGKTLAAFLWSLDQLAAAPAPENPMERCRVLYVSPLKALAVDIERNLRAPLAGIRQAAARLKLAEPDIRVGVRTGDTPAAERRALGRRPPDILITTPESLFLLLTSNAREALRPVRTVIVDEIHAVAATKRGAHLMLSLERLDALTARPTQRIGLSATVRPVEEVARFLGGSRPVQVVQPAAAKTFEISVRVPVPDMAEPGAEPGAELGAELSAGRGGQAADASADAAAATARSSIWPAIEHRVVELIRAHRSTIVFANSRRLAERLSSRLNEIAAEISAVETPGEPPREIARAHHGSVSREQRSRIEEALKDGRLPAVVATSSLELGIDMGAVDLVIQVESPPSVASGLQRLGRAGHQVGAVSRGVIYPKYRGDLLQAAVVAERMVTGAIEALRYPRNPLDVLAQQVVAMVAMQDWDVAELAALVRRAANFSALPDSAFEAVLDMLAGRYPSSDFAELRPRLVWDRQAGVLRGRPGAQRLAVTSGGTIPDRGLFGVFLVGESGSRVGELDEEMVYESRVGDVFALGSSSWRIEDITHDRVLVSPAPGQPGTAPFWHGDTLGRPLELGRAIGAFVRELAAAPPAEVESRCRQRGLDALAAANLRRYLSEQREATGVLPDDRTLVVERFRDELGDWRVVIHSPFGASVHAPWAQALTGRLRERYGSSAAALHADDGIVLRLPDTNPGGDEPLPAAEVLFEPEEIEQLVRAEVGGSALFAARFRECAARALLLPRRDPGRRTPLWQQRQRAAQLLSVAARFDTFPIVLETMRECLADVFDVPGLVELMTEVRSRRIRVVEVATRAPSPFARSLLFGYVAAFLYEGDAPLAERRAQALSLDPALLAELLGQVELRELLTPEAVAEVSARVSLTGPQHRARSAEDVADLLRRLGDLTPAEAAARGASGGWLSELEHDRRALRVRIAGEERWIAVEDAGRVQDALGVPLPVGVPAAFLAPGPDPLADLLARFARTHGPFTGAQAAARFGLGSAVAGDALARLGAAGRLVHGEFRPGGVDLEWCDAEVLGQLRRRSLAQLRAEIEPVPASTLGQFLPAWTRVGAAAGGEALARALDQLAGATVPASALESLVLPGRVPGYRPALLDQLCASGEFLWCGAGSLPGGDGWLSLCASGTAPLLLPAPDPAAVAGPLHEAILARLADGRAMFFRPLAAALPGAEDAAVLAAIWDLVWGGWLSNDTLAPLRAALAAGPRRGGPAGRHRPGRRELIGVGSAPPPGPPSGAGRWYRLADREPDVTRRTHALAEALLERHGVLTRGAVSAEHVPGGFAGLYPVLRAWEEAGRIRRGYFVEGLGAAQFALPGAVDRMRSGGRPETGSAVLLAAADPANPYGAALPWPPRPAAPGETGGHRPGRKSGALVVLVDGELILYLERGGASVLSWSQDPAVLAAAGAALAGAARAGALGRLTVERADGVPVARTPWAAVLEEAGFHPTPRGLRLRA